MIVIKNNTNLLLLDPRWRAVVLTMIRSTKCKLFIVRSCTSACVRNSFRRGITKGFFSTFAISKGAKLVNLTKKSIYFISNSTRQITIRVAILSAMKSVFPIIYNNQNVHNTSYLYLLHETWSNYQKYYSYIFILRLIVFGNNPISQILFELVIHGYENLFSSNV